MTSSLWNWLLFTFIQRDKVKWVCVTLNEGYQRAANRGRKNLYGFFNQNKNISALNEKKNFFGLSFYCFFETADLRSYCGYFLAICQLCLLFHTKSPKIRSFHAIFKNWYLEAQVEEPKFYFSMERHFKTPRSRKISVLVSKAVNKTSTFSNFRDPFLKCKPDKLQLIRINPCPEKAIFYFSTFHRRYLENHELLHPR